LRSSAAASPGPPFGDLDDFISQEELCALSDRDKRIAGYSIEQLGAPGPAPAK
jgi:hypothetical protein